MSIISRDPTFSWASPLATGDNVSERTTHTSSSHATNPKLFERRFVNIWKTLTRSTRKQKRASIYAKDFVFVTAAASRRRSINALQHASADSSRSSSPSSSSARGHHTL